MTNSESNSGEQQDAEHLIRLEVAKHVGKGLSSKPVELGGGAKVQVDGVDARSWAGIGPDLPAKRVLGSLSNSPESLLPAKIRILVC